MIAVPPVHLIDDGELDSVRALLEQLGADFERTSGASARVPVQHPETLLITSATLARSLRIQRSVKGSVPRATWLVFVWDPTESQRSALRASGFDFLVRMPVHEAALRVLVQRALFRGSDSRRAPRVVCGQGVTFKTGFWRQKATLIDLSLRGCRLLCSRPVMEKSEINVQLPKPLAGGRALDLLGQVVRVASEEAECESEGECFVGVRFAPIEGDARKRLQAVLAEHVLGPAPLRKNRVSKSVQQRRGPAPSVVDPATRVTERPTRTHRRSVYTKKVTAMEGGNAYLVMCRDISTGGMRIEPVEGLCVGGRLKLAIQLSARDEPFLVEASVLRDDHAQGLALQFIWTDSASRQRMQGLLDKLPAIEALQSDSKNQGTIIAERLPDGG